MVGSSGLEIMVDSDITDGGVEEEGKLMDEGVERVVERGKF